MVSQVDDSIVITQMGMMSSLGNLANGCGAFRAGMSRAAAFDDFLLVDIETREPLPLTVHQSPVTEGFVGYARLLRLAWPAFEDLGGRLSGLQPDTEVFLAVPDPGRVATGFGDAMKEAESDSTETDEEEEQSRLPDIPASLVERLSVQLDQLTSIKIPRENWHVVDSGHAGMAVALQGALKAFENGVRRCVIGGVDSLLDLTTLNWLAANQLLKTPTNPVGLMPGEAAVWALLERAGSATTTPLAKVVAVSVAVEPDDRFSENPPLGKALAEVIRQVSPDETPYWLATDLNGEEYRAMDWGHALVQLTAAETDRSENPVWYPAISFGDTGAASAGIAMCTATQAWARHYGPADFVVITSTSYDGYRSAICLADPSSP